ncbi:hypothetical protein [Sorangium sp. So ce233]|uniref:hypothetical protein n=1 Tax=Sorangium sp. So ce233 TaxID=3133290 RepID=UPI003F60367E
MALDTLRAERWRKEGARGIEVFPKQPKIRRSGFGNLVWLPWWQGAADGRDRHLAHYRIIAGRNSNAKTAQYRLIDVEAGDEENAAPGEQLSLDGRGGQA